MVRPMPALASHGAQSANCSPWLPPVMAPLQRMTFDHLLCPAIDMRSVLKNYEIYLTSNSKFGTAPLAREWPTRRKITGMSANTSVDIHIDAHRLPRDNGERLRFGAISLPGLCAAAALPQTRSTRDLACASSADATAVIVRVTRSLQPFRGPIPVARSPRRWILWRSSYQHAPSHWGQS
jgi:hypothetical protein